MNDSSMFQNRYRRNSAQARQMMDAAKLEQEEAENDMGGGKGGGKGDGFGKGKGGGKGGGYGKGDGKGDGKGGGAGTTDDTPDGEVDFEVLRGRYAPYAEHVPRALSVLNHDVIDIDLIVQLIAWLSHCQVRDLPAPPPISPHLPRSPRTSPRITSLAHPRTVALPLAGPRRRSEARAVRAPVARSPQRRPARPWRARQLAPPGPRGGGRA